MGDKDNLNLLEQDRLARECISNDIYTNYFVEAGAGSGKTTALVSRMTALVRSGVNVENICAITFTKAAANEFHDRFRRKLSECSVSPELTEEERRRCSDALRNIDLCFTGTIDSFCGMILNEHPVEAGVLPDSAVCTNRQMQKLYAAEYRRVAKGEYGEELQQKYYRFCSVHSNPFKVFSDWIGDFMDTRSAVLRFESPEDKAFDEDGEDKKVFVDMLRYISEHPEIWKSSRSDKVKKRKQDAADRIRDNLTLLQGSWSDHIKEILPLFKYSVDASLKNRYEFDIALTNDPGDYFIEQYGDFVVADISKKLGEPLSYQVDLKSSRSPVRKLRELQHAITLDFMDHFVRETAAALKQSGRLSYFDCLLYLRDMLRSDAEKGGLLAQHISKRHRYYLIDEFQDTNPMQAEVFFFLTSMEPKADWHECVPRPGSLFIVGDPKQSIYRFRNADVGAYLRVREMFKGEVGRTISLTRNFRSTKELCSWFDTVFSRMMNTGSDTQCGYNLIPVDDTKADSFGSLHGVYRYDAGQIKGWDYLVSMIKWIVGDDKHTVRDRDGEIRQVRYGDIMVITPNTTHLDSYVESFRSNGIPAFVEGVTMFDSCCVLSTAAKVLNAIAFPRDTIKGYEALKSPAFDVSDNDLRSWGALNRKCSVFSASDDEHFVYETVNKELLVLRELLNKARSMTVSATLMYIIDELRLYEKCGSDNLEYLHYAIELLRASEVTGSSSSLQDGARLVNSLIEGKLDGEKIDRCMSLAREENRVHIANLHKVKGLEAPIVILADPVSWVSQGRRESSIDKRVDYSGQEPLCYRFALTNYTETKGFEKEKAAELLAEDEEITRFRYVSATRARDMLIIADKRANDISDDTNIWYGLLDPDMPEISIDDLQITEETPEQSETGVTADNICAQVEKNGVFADRTSENKSYVIFRPSQAKVRYQTGAMDEPQDREESEYNEEMRSMTSGMNAAVIGTMVHRFMEELVSSRGKIDVDMLVESIRQEFLYLMKGCSKELTDILREVAAKITSGGFRQSNGVPDDIMQELMGADDIMCEVPFCLRSEKDGKTTISNGVMDLVYRKNGKWHIIDYKTGENYGNYAAQLEAYRDAFFALTGEEADAKVYHIDVKSTEKNK